MPPDTHLTITIPGRVPPTTLGPLRQQLEHAVQSVLGTHCEIDDTTIPLSREDARVTGYALLTMLRMHSIIKEAFQIEPLRHKARIHELAHKLVGNGEPYVERRSIQERADELRARATGDLPRPQQTAVDAMAARHGRLHVRPLADGALEITGLLDDIERETVCIEPDGRERWRR